jgi:hypothetical protein
VTEKIELEGRGSIELPAAPTVSLAALPSLSEVVEKKWPSGTKFTTADGKVYVLKLPVRVWKDTAAKPRAKRQTAAPAAVAPATDNTIRNAAAPAGHARG